MMQRYVGVLVWGVAKEKHLIVLCLNSWLARLSVADSKHWLTSRAEPGGSVVATPVLSGTGFCRLLGEVSCEHSFAVAGPHVACVFLNGVCKRCSAEQ